MATPLTQLSSYRVRSWPTGEHPLINSIQTIAQTSDGFLWVGTARGLLRFDGETFQLVPISLPGTNMIRRITALATSSDGILWAGTVTGLFQLSAGQWREVSLPPGGDPYVMCLQVTGKDQLWVATVGGLICWNEGTSQRFDPPAGEGKVLATMSIRAMALDQKNHLWFSGNDNVLRLSLDDYRSVVTYNYHEFKPDFIRGICCRRDGSVWIGGNAGVISFANGQYLHFTKADGLPDNTVSAIYEDRRGTLWVGTYGGLCRLVNGKFINEMTGEGEPFNQVTCFFEDQENTLWVGTKDGLYQLTPQAFTSLTTRHGLAHNNVVSVYEDAQTNLWIGTWGGGLHQVSDGKMTVYSAASTKVLRNDLVLALCGSHDGALWFGADYDNSFYCLKDRQVSRYDTARNAIRTIIEDHAGALWIGRASGSLNIFENGKFTGYGRESGLPTNAIRCLLQSRDGKIWVGTEAGLCVSTNRHFQALTTADGLSDNCIYALHEDARQNLWIGTGKGLDKLSTGTKPAAGATSVTPSIASCYGSDEAILEILEDDFNHLWLATGRGVIRVSKEELEPCEGAGKREPQITIFGRSDGMASQVCVGVAKPSAFRTRDGKLWFATTKGVAVTDPQLQIARNERPPPVVIEQVLADRTVQPATFNVQSPRRANHSTSNFGPGTLNLAPGRGELEFRYAALSYVAPEKNRFKYRLEGLDADWTDAGTRRAAFYNSVPPGDYTFRVVACNNDGIWNGAGASVRITLRPHAWQTWWFKSSAALLCFSMVGFGARAMTKRRMQMKLERLQQQHAVEKERIRIAQDMHDDLGARLSEILVLSNMPPNPHAAVDSCEPRLKRIAVGTRELVDNLDAIVWAVNPKHDSLESFVTYLQEYVAGLFETGSISCLFDVAESIPPLPLSSETRHNLFLIVKEALHNVVKHAGASEVNIQISVAGERLVLVLKDNGKGFSSRGDSSLGNGLTNMADRAAKMGGGLDVQSESGKGTRIRVEIPLKHP